MASDIRISELNEINVNSDINEIIINSRESVNDTGVSKKIQVANLLTGSIVKTNNIDDRSVTTAKIADKSISAIKIADKTITNGQILDRTICNNLLANDSVNPRVLSNEGSYTADEFVATGSLRSRNNTQVDNRLIVPSGNLDLRNIRYKFPATEAPRRFLRTDGSGNLTWAEAVPGDGTALVFSDTSPVGTVIPYAGGGSSVPDDKWINLGSQKRFLGSAYPELRDLLGTKWGSRTDSSGNPSPTGSYYALPDIRARAIVGNGQGDDGTNSCNTNFATYGGKYKHLLLRQEINHIHFTGTFSQSTNDDWFPFLINKPGTSVFNPGARDITNTAFCGRWVAGEGGRVNAQCMPAGPSVNKPYNAMTATQPLNDNKHMDNVAHDNVQPYVAMSYIIKAKPDDIQQYDMSVGPGLSALDQLGAQSPSVTLSSTEVGLKVSDDFAFDGSSRLKINDSWVEENLDLGKPLQYVNNHINTTHRYAKTADTDLHVTQLDTAITLKDANSKVYITAMITAESYTHNGVWKLFRKVGVTETEIGSNVSTGGSNRRGIATGMYDGNDVSTPNNIYIQYMDTPGSTAAEYIFKWNSDGTGNNYFTLNGARTVSTGEDYEQASSNVNLVEIGG